MKRFWKKLIGKIVGVFPVSECLIVFESEGDMADNSYALYEYMISNPRYDNYKYVWIVQDTHQDIRKKTKYIGKSGIFNCIKRIYYLSICSFYIYDHNNFFDQGCVYKKENQKIVNLWHGCGIKAAPYAKEKSNIDYLISTGYFFSDELSKVFGISKNKIFPVGYPRTDCFYKQMREQQKVEQEKLSRYKKVILWMPTFRRTSNKKLDEIYFNSYTGLPIITSEKDLLELDKFLAENNCICIFKIHHLQAQLPAFQRDFVNIKILKDFDIRRMGVQLYEYVMLTDALITDYSSVATDYMLLDRPILYTIDDYDAYKKSRGFCFENAIEYLAGYKAVNKKEFYSSIKEIIEGKDSYDVERQKVNMLFNDNRDSNHCEKILELIGVGK